MARAKQYVFSARTTEEGLKRLGQEKAKRGVNWDELVIEAVSAYYDIDKAMMTLAKKEKPLVPEAPQQQTVVVECPADASVSDEPVETKAANQSKQPKSNRAKKQAIDSSKTQC